MRIVVLGASGMLGFALHRVLHDRGWDVVGAARGAGVPAPHWRSGLRYVPGVDVRNLPEVARLLDDTRATVVVNAAGVIKQVSGATDHEQVIAINAVFPRLLDTEAAARGLRVIHFSTDCVFSGRQGGYREDDRPDATDMYGMSKFLGEAAGPQSLVLRTSIIGRGLTPNHSLIDWFLSQSGSVRGFRHAVFSGMPVHEIGAVLAARLLPRLDDLRGLYHLSAEPIDKCTLLELVRAAWGRDDLQIQPDESFRIDRSLQSSRLRAALGYKPPPWPELVTGMHAFYAALEQGRTPATH